MGNTAISFDGTWDFEDNDKSHSDTYNFSGNKYVHTSITSLQGTKIDKGTFSYTTDTIALNSEVYNDVQSFIYKFQGSKLLLSDAPIESSSHNPNKFGVLIKK